MKRIIAISIVCLALAGCAPGHNDLRDTSGVSGEAPAGFLLGWWQGAISPITFFISLFNDNVSVYEVHNNGGWYNFGFLIGAGALLKVSSSCASRRK